MFAQRDDRVEGDAGMSMIELLVGMLIMTIFGGMFTGAVVMINSTANKVEAVTATTSTLNNAFLSLDRTVRYSATITTPGVSTGTGDWYVELQTTNTGTEACTQLRMDIASAQLQRRTWAVASDGSAASLTGWTPLAGSLLNASAAAGSADQPFVLTNPSGSGTFQKLGIVLTTASGNTATATSRSSITYPAINSIKDSTTSTATPCQQVTRP